MPRLPYPGLRPFNRDEADLFFGRDDEIDQMVALLTRNRFLGVLGASGSGKSSVVRTGLFEALEGGTNIAGSTWQIVDVRPGSEPIARLAAALSAASARPGGAAAPGPTEERLRSGPRSILHWCEEGNLAPGANLLILVDQFEELFNDGNVAVRGDAQVLAGLLVESARSREVPIYVVLTMRSDYFGACGAYPELARTISDSIFLTPRMLREACEEAILGPAAVLEFEIEDSLLTLLLNDLEQFAAFEGESGQAGGQAARQADQLPLLQYALNQLWQRASARSAERLVLTVGDYEEIGGLAGALDRQGEATIATLKLPERDIERVFRTLIKGPSVALATRDPHRIREIAAIASLDVATVIRIVGAFASDDCQFLRMQAPGGPDSWVDIPHESLIRQWRRLSQWFERERDAAELWRRLAADASEWDEQRRDPDMLLAGTQLVRRREWWMGESPSQPWTDRYPVERAGGGTTPAGLVGEYLDAGQARQEIEFAAERRRKRTRRLAGGGAAVAVLVGSVGFGLVQQRAAAALEQSRGELVVAVADAKLQTRKAEEAGSAREQALLNARESAADALTQRDAARRATARAEQATRIAEQRANETSLALASAEQANRTVVAGAKNLIGQLEHDQRTIGKSTLSRYELARQTIENILPDTSSPDSDYADVRRRYDRVLGNAALELMGSDGKIADESAATGFDYLSGIGVRLRSNNPRPGDVALTYYWDARMAEQRGEFQTAVERYHAAFQAAPADPTPEEGAASTKARAATGLVRLARLGVPGTAYQPAAEWCRTESARWDEEAHRCRAELIALLLAQGQVAETEAIFADLIRDMDLPNEPRDDQSTALSTLLARAQVAKITGGINWAWSNRLVQQTELQLALNQNSEEAWLIHADMLDASGDLEGAFQKRVVILGQNASIVAHLEALPSLQELNATELPSLSELEGAIGANGPAGYATPPLDEIEYATALLGVLEELETHQAPEPLSPPGQPAVPRLQLLADTRRRLDQVRQLAIGYALALAAHNNLFSDVARAPDTYLNNFDHLQLNTIYQTLEGVRSSCGEDAACEAQVNALLERPDLDQLSARRSQTRRRIQTDYLSGEDTSIGLSGYDPVSYSDIAHGLGPVRGRESISLPEAWPSAHGHENRRRLLFASEENRAAYERNPSAYRFAYDGLAADGMAMGEAMLPDPRLACVLDGRIFLFRTAGGRTDWCEGEASAESIAIADEHWRSPAMRAAPPVAFEN